MAAGLPSQTTPLSVFIDDTDSAIQYEGDWTTYQGYRTDLRSLDYPHDLRTPWYGTVSMSVLSNTRLSYGFNGTSLISNMSLASVSMRLEDISVNYNAYLL